MPQLLIMKLWFSFCLFFPHLWEKDGAEGRFSPESWCFLPDRRTDPHPDGTRWAASAPGSRWCPAGWTALHVTGASAAAPGSDRAAPTQSAPTLRCWSHGTRRGCRRSACLPYTSEPHGPPLRAHWMETHSPQGHLQTDTQTEWWILKCSHDYRMSAHETEEKKKLTCHVEEDDAWILSYFVASRASVEGMSLSFLNLQRAHNFLGKCIYFVNNCALNKVKMQQSLFNLFFW